MGSITPTCTLSRAPIEYDQKVRLFFLASNTNVHKPNLKLDQIGNGTFWNPYSSYKLIGGISVVATYQDYYRFEFEDSLEVDYLVECVRELYDGYQLDLDALDDYDRERTAATPSEIDMETITNMIREGTLFLKPLHPAGASPYVSLMMVHECVYQKLLEQTVYSYGFPVNVGPSPTHNKGLVDYIALNTYKMKSGVILDYYSHPQYEKHRKTAVKVLGKLDGSVPEEAAIHELAKYFVDSEISEDNETFRWDYTYEVLNPFKHLEKFAVKNGYTHTFADIIERCTETEFVLFVLNDLGYMLQPSPLATDDSSIYASKRWAVKMANALSEICQDEEYIGVTHMVEEYTEISLSSIESELPELHVEGSHEHSLMLYYIDIFKAKAEKGMYVIPVSLVHQGEYLELWKLMGLYRMDTEVRIAIDC